MKTLIVASYNKGSFAPFVVEQVDALCKAGVECAYFGIEGKGMKGYFRNFKTLKKIIKDFKPNVIHAHYGLSGLLANLQRRVPVITTFHGSDINNSKILKFSKLCMILSKFNVFVSENNAKASRLKSKYLVLPCGVNIEFFSERSKQEAKQALNWDENDKYVVFAGAFDNHVKNASLAKETVSKLDNVHLIELKGFSRQDVANIFYASDALLMTSFTEGSPQVIKEAMACGCPIVSVDVGDVAIITRDVDGCFISERNADSLAFYLEKVLSFDGRTNGRKRLFEMGLTNDLVVKKLLDLYLLLSDKRKMLHIP